MKILDFGLARQSGSAAAASDETSLETGTSPGVVLGTVGYMSPEQVRAQPVDHRSDLFSLGVVLYEMLSGRRPFARESAVETMNAILTEDPPDPAAPGNAVPATLATIVRHCLEKQPGSRHSAGCLPPSAGSPMAGGSCWAARRLRGSGWATPSATR